MCKLASTFRVCVLYFVEANPRMMKQTTIIKAASRRKQILHIAGFQFLYTTNGVILQTRWTMPTQTSIRAICLNIRRCQGAYFCIEDKTGYRGNRKFLSTTQPSVSYTHHHVKRRVALLVAYDGSFFNGSFWISPPNGMSPELYVEGAIVKAAERAGLILPTNAELPSKVGLLRLSRTDKGVHSIGNIFSLKIELPDDTLQQCAEVTKSLNEKLPAYVRVLKTVRVGRSFQPRMRADFRQYRYYCPAVMLPQSLDSIIIKEYLPQFETTFHAHNFCAGYSRTMRKTERKLAYRRELEQSGRNRGGRERRFEAPSQLDLAHCDHDTFNDSSEIMETHMSSNGARSFENNNCISERSTPEHLHRRVVKPGEREKVNLLLPTLYRKIEHIILERAIVHGTEFAIFTIRGTSFVYHQIRKMLGIIIAISRGYIKGGIPLLEAFINSRFVFKTPLAPAQFLLLDYTPDNIRATRYREPKTNEIEVNMNLDQQELALAEDFRDNVLVAGMSHFVNSDNGEAAFDLFREQAHNCRLEDDELEWLLFQTSKPIANDEGRECNHSSLI